MQTVYIKRERKKKWKESDDWLTLFYALFGSLLVALVMAGVMFR